MNKVVLIGRLTKNPELRYAPGSGTAVCRFSLAVDRMKKDQGADFINCVSFGKTAETITQYLTKGKKLALEGHIQTGSYDNKEGKKVYTFDVAVDRFEFVDSAKGGQANNQDYFNQQGNFSQEEYTDGMAPVDDGDLPF